MDRTQLSFNIRAFRKSLRTLEDEIERSLASQTDCCGVSVAQCHLILELEDKGEASIGELALALELDASTLSRTVDGLVKQGFATRMEDPSNRRRQLVALSELGETKAAEINELCDRHYSGILHSMPEEKRGSVAEAVGLLALALRAGRAKGACGGSPSLEKERAR